MLGNLNVFGRSVKQMCGHRGICHIWSQGPLRNLTYGYKKTVDSSKYRKADEPWIYCRDSLAHTVGSGCPQW